MSDGEPKGKIPMRAIVASVVVFLAAQLPVLADLTQRALAPRPLNATFVMALAEGGKAILETFELWSINGTVAGVSAGIRPPLELTSVVFTNLVKERTDVLVERHDTLAIREVQPGTFQMRFTGNGKGCSDLEVVASYSADYSTLLNLSGSARGGLNCELLYTYTLSREKLRPIAPLTNGLYLAFPSLR
jgi:hypothetical protein